MNSVKLMRNVLSILLLMWLAFATLTGCTTKGMFGYFPSSSKIAFISSSTSTTTTIAVSPTTTTTTTMPLLAPTTTTTTIVIPPTTTTSTTVPVVIQIIQQPSNQATTNGSAGFSVVASVSGGASLNYQWQKQYGGLGSFTNITNGGSVAGATSDSLSLTSLTHSTDSSDVYRVVLKASGATDVISASATLTVNPAVKPFCGGPGDSCYDSAAAKTAGVATLTGTSQDIEYVKTDPSCPNSCVFVWKQLNGDYVLNATGYWTSGLLEWQFKLNRSGLGFAADYFIAKNLIGGRACPTNVFINRDFMTEANQCVYYDLGNDFQPLDKHNGIDATDFLTQNTSPATGSSVLGSFFEGNIYTCAEEGMRLPTLYETATGVDTSYSSSAPIDATPVYSGNRVPAYLGKSWTASAYTDSPNAYWVWQGAYAADSSLLYNDSTATVRCVLPSGPEPTTTTTTTIPPTTTTTTIPATTTTTTIPTTTTTQDNTTTTTIVETYSCAWMCDSTGWVLTYKPDQCSDKVCSFPGGSCPSDATPMASVASTPCEETTTTTVPATTTTTTAPATTTTTTTIPVAPTGFCAFGPQVLGGFTFSNMTNTECMSTISSNCPDLGPDDFCSCGHPWPANSCTEYYQHTQETFNFPDGPRTFNGSVSPISQDSCPDALLQEAKTITNETGCDTFRAQHPEYWDNISWKLY